MRHFMSPIAASLIAGSLLMFAAANTNAQNKNNTWLTTNMQARTIAITGGTMHYRLFVPAGYNPSQKYPIVVALHGIGEKGNNNTAQIYNEELPQPWIRDSVQAKHPHFVMVPQCPSSPNLFWWPSGTWQGNRSAANIGIVTILDSLKKEFSLDTTRFYAAGLSMGGFGTIELMKWNPTMFAAAVPTAGGGDTGVAAIAEMIKTPTWFFHSLTDGTVSAERGSRWLVKKFQGAGKKVVRFASNPNMASPTAFVPDSANTLITMDSVRKAVYVDSADFLYSEVRNTPGSGNDLHRSGWMEAWRHPMLTDWVFSKRKGGSTVSVNAALSTRPLAPANVRVVFRDGRTLLEKTVAGSTALYTLEGKRATDVRP